MVLEIVEPMLDHSLEVVNGILVWPLGSSLPEKPARVPAGTEFLAEMGEGRLVEHTGAAGLWGAAFGRFTALGSCLPRTMLASALATHAWRRCGPCVLGENGYG